MGVRYLLITVFTKKGGAFVKIQEIDTFKGKGWILFDDDYEVILPVKDYAKHLENIGRTPNTIKNYLYHLKVYFEYWSVINV